ncbi:HprK-related kinase A [Aestuariirhabdus sp. Z084]|uniref:HprK-related kinase A n=1 Tax=Aestuariirhabdus haliotis TaxID=2918751 RepID=UPI00201B364D|nr:HprK-related kinase A [Aestuariirhabdus haliotis]MCL6416778.1 HprK-related kinase A [Aestuariirhabdus haliotis]MCL6420757.1 HprK-related kinase A [Aestuariirhabdus haliotis]
MRVVDLQQNQLEEALRDRGIWLRAWPFLFHIRSSETALASGVAALYANYPVALDGDWADFHLRICAVNGLRKLFRPQVNFYLDRLRPFKPLPRNQSFAFLEWGMNWCVANHLHRYLILHCAVVAKGDDALLLPGASGSGKSTLCAALVARGWRLLSDELALVDPVDQRIQGFVRPISLKNQSIEVIRDFAPNLTLGEVVEDTQKGSVAHARPPDPRLHEGLQSATVRWVLFPHYQSGKATELHEMPKGNAFMQLQEQAFNYQLHGESGFDTLTRLIQPNPCYELHYSNLDEVVQLLDSTLSRAELPGVLP